MVSHAPAVRVAGPRVSRIGAYVALTKPRIIELLLVTALPTMIVAERGLPPIGLIVATLIGGTLAAGGANAINMYVDRDIDSVMHRTRNRPLVTGSVTPAAALTFACALEVAAFAELWRFVNLLSAVLALSATAFYVGIYTLWLLSLIHILSVLHKPAPQRDLKWDQCREGRCRDSAIMLSESAIQTRFWD